MMFDTSQYSQLSALMPEANDYDEEDMVFNSLIVFFSYLKIKILFYFSLEFFETRTATNESSK